MGRVELLTVNLHLWFGLNLEIGLNFFEPLGPIFAFSVCIFEAVAPQIEEEVGSLAPLLGLGLFGLRGQELVEQRALEQVELHGQMVKRAEVQREAVLRFNHVVRKQTGCELL